MKSKVYIETSIPSYLCARISKNLLVAANQEITHEWWERCKDKFDLVISEIVVREVSAGHPEVAKRRLSKIEKYPKIAITDEVGDLAQILINEVPIPKKSELDAFHIAVTAINGIEYLLTWNCKHIANAVLRPKINKICRKFGCEPPIICTPQELMEV